jgi:hypothetical protein
VSDVEKSAIFSSLPPPNDVLMAKAKDNLPLFADKPIFRHKKLLPPALSAITARRLLLFKIVFDVNELE